MKTIEELKKLREESFNDIKLRLDNRKYKVYVHLDENNKDKSKELFQYILSEVEIKGLNCYVILGEVSKNNGVNLSICDGDNTIEYHDVTKETVDEILLSHIQNYVVLEKYVKGDE